MWWMTLPSRPASRSGWRARRRVSARRGSGPSVGTADRSSGRGGGLRARGPGASTPCPRVEPPPARAPTQSTLVQAPMPRSRPVTSPVEYTHAAPFQRRHPRRSAPGARTCFVEREHREQVVAHARLRDRPVAVTVGDVGEDARAVHRLEARGGRGQGLLQLADRGGGGQGFWAPGPASGPGSCGGGGEVAARASATSSRPSAPRPDRLIIRAGGLSFGNGRSGMGAQECAAPLRWRQRATARPNRQACSGPAAPAPPLPVAAQHRPREGQRARPPRQPSHASCHHAPPSDGTTYVPCS